MAVLDRKWWTLIAVCTATFMLLLDITVVNVALPDIQRSLHSSFSDLQWVVDAYSLTLAAFLLTAGVLGDMFGRRAIFAIGLVIFSASSLVCGLASSSTMLNFSRAVQGVGGAIMFATSVALIASAFQGKERGTAFGIYGAVLGGAVAIGPLVGGALTSSVGWRWIFFVNVPVGVVAVAITLAKVAESREPNTRRIDWIGFVSLSGCTVHARAGLVRGNYDGWKSPLILGLFVGSAVLLRRLLGGRVAPGRSHARPQPVPAAGHVRGLGRRLHPGRLHLRPLPLHHALHPGRPRLRPAGGRLRFLPITMMAFVVAPLAGKLTVRMQSRYLLGGGLLLVTGRSAAHGHDQPTSGWTQLLPGFIVTGAGIGMVNPVLASASVSVVPFQRSGMASGANATFRQIGIATGIAGLGAIFASQIQSKTIRRPAHQRHRPAGGAKGRKPPRARPPGGRRPGRIGARSPSPPLAPRCSMPTASGSRAPSTS